MATLSGTLRDSSGALAARIVRAYYKDSGILAAETTSNATTGAFSLTVLPHYHYTVVALDAVYDPYCQLLMHMNGADNGMTFTEETGRVVTRYGDAKTVTAYSAFGGSSAYFDGSGDYLSVPCTSDLLVGAGDFTIEAFVRPTGAVSASNYVPICGRYDSASNQRSYALELYATAGGVQQVALLMSTLGTGADLALYGTFTCPSTRFTHIRGCRQGSTAYIFADGALLNTSNVGTASLFENASTPFSIGARGPGTTFINGYIDEVRFSKGVARSTADFSATPVTEPFSRLIKYSQNALVFDDVVPV